MFVASFGYTVDRGVPREMRALCRFGLVLAGIFPPASQGGFAGTAGVVSAFTPTHPVTGEGPALDQSGLHHSPYRRADECGHE